MLTNLLRISTVPYSISVFFNKQWKNHNWDTRQRNNLYLPQANVSIYQKGAYYSGIKIFNNLPLEIKNAAGNQKKKISIVLKQFLCTYSFYTIEGYLSKSWITYCITRSLLQWYIDLRFCRCALYKYSWIMFKFCLSTLCTYSLIVYFELITFPCINLICLIYIL
jgi:hypothetical protein